jgi:hypothetical protein
MRPTAITKATICVEEARVNTRTGLEARMGGRTYTQARLLLSCPGPGAASLQPELPLPAARGPFATRPPCVLHSSHYPAIAAAGVTYTRLTAYPNGLDRPHRLPLTCSSPRSTYISMRSTTRGRRMMRSRRYMRIVRITLPTRTMRSSCGRGGGRGRRASLRLGRRRAKRGNGLETTVGEIEIEIGTPERTRAWTLGAVGWASRMLSARIRMRPPYAPLPHHRRCEARLHCDCVGGPGQPPSCRGNSLVGASYTGPC